MGNDVKNFKFYLPIGAGSHAGESDCVIRAFSSALGQSYFWVRSMMQRAVPDSDFFKDPKIGFTTFEIEKFLDSIDVEYRVGVPSKGCPMKVRDLIGETGTLLIACERAGEDRHMTTINHGKLVDYDPMFLDFDLTFFVFVYGSRSSVA